MLSCMSPSPLRVALRGTTAPFSTRVARPAAPARRTFTVAAAITSQQLKELESQLEPVKCATLGRTDLELSWDDDSAPDQVSKAAWHDWMGGQLSEKLVGVRATTRRAVVAVTGVKSANIVKGLIRAEQLDVVLDLKATHLTSGVTSEGVVRVILKTEGGRDHLLMSDVKWTDAKMEGTKEMTDFNVVVETPLETSLACHLNDLLWSVEQHSYETIDEDDGEDDDDALDEIAAAVSAKAKK